MPHAESGGDAAGRTAGAPARAPPARARDPRPGPRDLRARLPLPRMAPSGHAERHAQLRTPRLPPLLAPDRLGRGRARLRRDGIPASALARRAPPEARRPVRAPAGAPPPARELRPRLRDRGGHAPDSRACRRILGRHLRGSQPDDVVVHGHVHRGRDDGARLRSRCPLPVALDGIQALVRSRPVRSLYESCRPPEANRAPRRSASPLPLCPRVGPDPPEATGVLALRIARPPAPVPLVRPRTRPVPRVREHLWRPERRLRETLEPRPPRPPRFLAACRRPDRPLPPHARRRRVVGDRPLAPAGRLRRASSSTSGRRPRSRTLSSSGAATSRCSTTSSRSFPRPSRWQAPPLPTSPVASETTAAPARSESGSSAFLF